MKNKTLRETIIAACPEILDLKFGCKIEVAGCADGCCSVEEWVIGNGIEIKGRHVVGHGYQDLFYLNEILGCPIELHHVLRAIRKSNHVWETELEWLTWLGTLIEHKWNLREPLENQTEELKSFLEKLLVTE